MTGRRRCAWARRDLDVRYHDREWGVPLRNDRALFELLTLEGAQAGLSWSTVLAKRPAYRRAFARFDPRAVARFTARDVRRLLADAGIVRHRGKIESTIANARAFLAVQAEHGSFARWLWRLVEDRPVQNRWRSIRDVPAETELSSTLSRELRARGFRFVGPTICYAFMQAAGLVNDHTVDCFRWGQTLTSQHRRRDVGGSRGGVGKLGSDPVTTRSAGRPAAAAAIRRGPAGSRRAARGSPAPSARRAGSPG